MAALLSVAARASAEDVDAIIKRGTNLGRQGRDADALKEFQRALQLDGSPRVMAQMGLAEQALGLWVEANTHLAGALEHDHDPWISAMPNRCGGRSR